MDLLDLSRFLACGAFECVAFLAFFDALYSNFRHLKSCMLRLGPFPYRSSVSKIGLTRHQLLLKYHMYGSCPCLCFDETDQQLS